MAVLPRNAVDDPSLRNRSGVFADRAEAGAMLAEMLRGLVGGAPLVLTIPSGGIPVGIAIHGGLGGSLQLIPVRKLVIPFEPEAGFGAISWDGEMVLNEALVNSIGLTTGHIERSVALARRELRRRMERFRVADDLPTMKDRTVILVDDGLASGYTMLAALRSARKRHPLEAVVAVPTGHLAAVAMVASEASSVCCLNVRTGPSFAVADAYRHWRDISDDEAARMLQEALVGGQQ